MIKKQRKKKKRTKFRRRRGSDETIVGKECKLRLLDVYLEYVAR